jgi:hypothetical protein
MQKHFYGYIAELILHHTRQKETTGFHSPERPPNKNCRTSKAQQFLFY